MGISAFKTCELIIQIANISISISIRSITLDLKQFSLARAQANKGHTYVQEKIGTDLLCLCSLVKSDLTKVIPVAGKRGRC